MQTVDNSSLEPTPYITVSLDDERYPVLLREIHDPPSCLYVRGNPAALSRPMLAIVGSRRASSAGLRLARSFAHQLGEAGLQICSGLALGIDGAAHSGAVDAQGNTLAVMATGIEAVYPKRHQELAQHICSQGCLVTEFPPGTPPRRENFPQRNRIISGMSLGVLVVEAALASGSLITARTAMEQGREVFALPWSPLHTGGAGCLQLLGDGAKLVSGIEDILEELGPLYALACPTADAEEVSEKTRGVNKGLLGLIGFEAVSLEDILQDTALPVSEVLAALTQLELEKKVIRVDGGYVRA
jgi:DNA processing protein